MSRLEELIAELCPDGVKYKSLETVCGFISGFAFRSSTFSDTGEPVCKTTNIQNNVVCFDGMDCISLEDYNENLDKYLVFPQDIVIGMSGTIKVGINNSNRTCYLNQRVGKFLPFKEALANKYLYYVLCNSIASLAEGVTGGSVKNISNRDILSMSIPVPPLPVQREIVRILDIFTKLNHELNEELELRKRQFSAYSSLLFMECKEESIATISDVCRVEKGKTPIQKAIPGEYPMVVTTTERKTSVDFQFEEPSVCIPLVSSRGHGVASLNHVYYQEGRFALGNILCALTPKSKNHLLAKYLYYYFEQTKDYTIVPLMKGGANVALRIDDILKVKIPVPSIDRQKEIIRILQVFEEYWNTVLPVEIAARQKQYEYYREKLLTFKPKEGVSA